MRTEDSSRGRRSAWQVGDAPRDLFNLAERDWYFAAKPVVMRTEDSSRGRRSAWQVDDALRGLFNLAERDWYFCASPSYTSLDDRLSANAYLS